VKKLKMDHLHFFVTDLDKAIEFYEDIGFKMVHMMEHGGRSAAQLEATNLTIDLNLTKAADNPGYSHFALSVEDLEEEYKRLTELGYEIDAPIINKETKRKILTLRDPNGFLVQLVQEVKL
jgi:catechol 2,3-dioxygenase-like lactoylglutathione lyase family enzyme